MNDVDLVKKIQSLKILHASEKLRRAVGYRTSSLPDKHRGFYFPLFAFQTSFVAAVIVLFIGVGSGVVIAAKGSHPGTPFYPVRQMLQKVAPQVIQENPTPMPVISSPTSTPIILHKEQEQEEKHGEKKDVQGASTQDAVSPTVNSTPRGNEQQNNNFIKSFMRFVMQHHKKGK